jgi:hypothetical protein
LLVFSTEMLPVLPVCLLRNIAALVALLNYGNYSEELLWSSGQRSGFESRRYQIFLSVGGLERVPLSLVRITEAPFQGNSGSGIEN